MRHAAQVGLGPRFGRISGFGDPDRLDRAGPGHRSALRRAVRSYSSLARSRMLVLSSVLAVPLVWTAQAFTRAHRSLQAAVGVATMVLGTLLLVEAGGAL